MCGPKFCLMQTKVDADALTELEKFRQRKPSVAKARVSPMGR